MKFRVGDHVRYHDRRNGTITKVDVKTKTIAVEWEDGEEEVWWHPGAFVVVALKMLPDPLFSLEELTDV